MLAEPWWSVCPTTLDLTIDPGCVEAAVSTARQYLSTSSFPGAVLDLIKLTVARGAKAGERIDAHR